MQRALFSDPAQNSIVYQETVQPAPIIQVQSPVSNNQAEYQGYLSNDDVDSNNNVLHQNEDISHQQITLGNMAAELSHHKHNYMT